MTSNDLIVSKEITMSSLEIAELVESRHDKVRQSMERLAERGVIQLPPLGRVKNNQGQTISVYYLNKRDSIVTVAQLSPEFTARLVDRWQELEGKVKPKSRSEALLEMVTELVEHERRIGLLENKLESVSRYETALEFSLRYGMATDKESLRRLGVIASSRSREAGIDILTKHQDHVGFRGNVNAYHPDILNSLI